MAVFDEVIKTIINDIEKEKTAAYEEYNRQTLPFWIAYGERLNKIWYKAEASFKQAAIDYFYEHKGL
jgi:hypothetical protein